MINFNINDITISPLELKELKTVLDIQNDLNIHILSKENILNNKKNSNFYYYVVKYMNNVIGFISFSYIIDIEIESIVIKKDFQRKGIGSLLINFIFEYAKTNNINNIFLEVRKSNIPAIQLYNKYGFYQINTRKNYYINPNEDALILKKEFQHKL